MKRKLPFSDEISLEKYLRLIELFSDTSNRILFTRTLIRSKLANRKILRRVCTRLLRFDFLISLKSYILATYTLLKKYYLLSSNSFLGLLSIRNLAFLVYHFINLYNAIFLLKMILEWFPVKNWDGAQPLIRFIRKVTNWWTKKFEKFIPSAFAWIIVINIVPLLLLFLGHYYKVYDLKSFPTTSNSEEFIKLMLACDFF